MTILSFLGITDAYADLPSLAGTATANSGTGQGLLSMLPMLVILALFMYFMIIRPQQKRAKEHRNLVGALQKGDEVVTTGGILGTIEKITDTFIILSVAEGVNITIQKNAVLNCLPKGSLKASV